MIEIFIEPNDDGWFFVRTDINDHLIIADGKLPSTALHKLAKLTLEVEQVDIFAEGFTLTPQSKIKT